jgi:hypothetical protein
MLMRFWDRLDLIPSGEATIDIWVDEWHTQNPEHLAAWNLFVSETGCDPSQLDAEKVPIGMGFEYLPRVTKPQKIDKRVVATLIVTALFLAFFAICRDIDHALRDLH